MYIKIKTTWSTDIESWSDSDDWNGLDLVDLKEGINSFLGAMEHDNDASHKRYGYVCPFAFLVPSLLIEVVSS